MLMPVGDAAIEIIQGDITDLKVDAIVNAANSALQLGGGVAGAIRRKGGPRIQQECNKIGSCPVGNAVITTGGELSAQYVIHAVGPRMGEGDEDFKLMSATLNSLKLAERHGIETIAFPAISTGVFGYPLDRCAAIMLPVTIGFISDTSVVRKVSFCLFDLVAFELFCTELERL